MQNLDWPRGGFSTKIHLIVDACGNQVDFLVSPGQSHERRHALSLLMRVEAGCALGDLVYHGSPIREAIAIMGAEAVIPPHPPRNNRESYDCHLYKARHVIESLFAKLKQ